MWPPRPWVPLGAHCVRCRTGAIMTDLLHQRVHGVRRATLVACSDFFMDAYHTVFDFGQSRVGFESA